MKLLLQARHLQIGDIMHGSNEIIKYCGAGLRTPKGKVEVWLHKEGRDRQSFWGKYRLVNVFRPTIGVVE